MTEITVTLRQILDAEPCYDPREKGLLPADHDLDAPITFREIAKNVEPNVLIWCFAYAIPGNEALKRNFAVDCAERLNHTMTDRHGLNDLAVARRYAMGAATDYELVATWDGALIAALAAGDASLNTNRSMWAAAWTLSWDASCAASWAASWAASCAASCASEKSTEREWQVSRIIELAEAGEWTPALDTTQ